jgi:hypothetical protein
MRFSLPGSLFPWYRTSFFQVTADGLRSTPDKMAEEARTMLYPDTEIRRRSDRVGYGIFATSFIPKGTITWVLDGMDQILSMHEVAQMDPSSLDQLIKYSYVNGHGNRVLCWDLTRFMNHHCEPNILSPGLPVEIAVRDIHENEELTNDYGALNIEEDFECSCGSLHCRGIIRDADFERLASLWDLQLREAAKYAPLVPQPLTPWLHPEHGSLDRFRFPDPLPSVLANRWRAVGTEIPLPGPAIRRSRMAR